MALISIVLAAFLQVTASNDVRQVTLAQPQTVAEIDVGKMKGDLTRLAWSPDASEFYVQTAERDRGGSIKSLHHYIVSAASKTVKGADQEPPWASKYWAWKSAQMSPAAPGFRITVDEPRRETKRSTAAPTGGILAKGGVADPGVGSTVADVASAAEQTQVLVIYTLKLKNETIGEWTNEAVTPGINFTWAPAPLRLFAFAKRDGGPIVVLDDAGRKQELTGAKAAVLPAWSDDGKRLAWLERKDKKKYQLTFADIAVP